MIKIKTYTVKQIAEMLDIKEETVRRWIRSNKLPAIQVSRKDGNVVKESDLERFLSAMPKYLTRMPTVFSAMTPIVSATALGMEIALGAKSYYKKNNSDYLINTEDMEKYLNEKICLFRERIESKKQMIIQINDEIAELEKEILQCQNQLNSIRTEEQNE